MRTELLKISDIKTNLLTDIDISEFKIPVEVSEIKKRPYTAITPANLVKAGKEFVMVETTPSLEYSGYINYSIVGMTGKLISKKPVLAEFVGLVINSLLDRYSISCSDMKWKVDENNANEITCSDYVYFLKAGRFIKIGKTTGSPSARISQLQTGCPFHITLIAYIRGGIKEESQLHKRFKKYKTHGEWFFLDGELSEFIESIKGNN
mgnify:CR=1 FL=1